MVGSLSNAALWQSLSRGYLNYETVFSAPGSAVSVPLLPLEQYFIAIVLNLFLIKFRVSENCMSCVFVFYSVCTNFLHCSIFFIGIWKPKAGIIWRIRGELGTHSQLIFHCDLAKCIWRAGSWGLHSWAWIHLSLHLHGGETSAPLRRPLKRTRTGAGSKKVQVWGGRHGPETLNCHRAFENLLLIPSGSLENATISYRQFR